MGSRTSACARRIGSALACASLAVIAHAAAAGAAVRIADASGAPIPGATALCLDPASAEPVAAREGVAELPAFCRHARCDASGFLAAEVEIGDGGAACVLRQGLVVSGEVPASAVGSGVEARLAGAGASKPVATIAIAKPAAGTVARFAFPTIAPGRYVLDLARAADGWSCRADLGPLGPGRRTVIPEWREPMRVTVRVVDSGDKPAAKVSVRALPVPRASPKPVLGAWSCAPTAPGPVATDAKGTASVVAARGEDTWIVAGDWKDPHGIAFASIDRPMATPLALKLVRPAVLRAQILDEGDRPVACRASLEARATSPSSPAGVPPGEGTSGACAPDGALSIGPFYPRGGILEIAPTPGLPLRLTIDPPAPGSAVDLGVVRVPRGASIRVMVRDPEGNPIPKAKVTARGTAGIILSVAGTTDVAGTVDLAGFPKSSSLVIDVEAHGYVEGRKEGLQIADSPFAIVLSPGAALAGSVHDRNGAPIAGAAIEASTAGSRSPSRALADADGRFSIDGLPDGAYEAFARAEGYAASRSVRVEIRERKADGEADLVLDPAPPLRGRVVGPSGAAVAGARVILLERDAARDLDSAPVDAEAASGADGAFELASDVQPEEILVALHPGFAPGVVRSPANAQKEGEVVVALGDPSTLRVHYTPRDGGARRIAVIDGNGLGRGASTNGSGETDLQDLSAGDAAVSMVGGRSRDVALIASRAVDVTLDDAPWIEGTVTVDGAPAPRVYVHAGEESPERSGGGDGAFTDERGAYRIDGLGAGTWRVVAVGEDGRADTKVTLPDSGPTRVDLALRMARLEVTVVSADGNAPVPHASVGVKPGGASCTYLMSTTSWSGPGTLGFHLDVGGNGCLGATTDAAGVARLVVDGPGDYDLSIEDPGYDSYKAPVALGEGTTTRRVVLTPKAKPGKGTVHVRLSTDPPGLAGTFMCLQAGSSRTNAPVRGEQDCADLHPGPVDVVFRVDGFGAGHVAIDVPDGGEVSVDLEVVRGGRLIVPASASDAKPPTVADGTGFVWADATGRGPLHGAGADLPDVGRAWVIDDLPPGTYTVTLEGTPRNPVPLASGGTAIAY